MNLRRKRFCEEYVKDLDGKAAAIRAGYTEKAATALASQMLKYDEVREYLEKLQKKVAKRNDITVDELIQDLAEIKNINIADLYNDSGEFKSMKDLPREFTKCIQEVTQTDTMGKTTTKVKFYSRLDSIEKLARHLGFYEKDNKQLSPDTNIFNLDFRNKDGEADKPAEV